MKIGNWKLKILNSRGEIATILTVVTLGLMLVGTFVGTKLAERSTEQRTQARGFGELQTQALTGCRVLDTDLGPGCWCAEGGWQFHCFGGSDPNARRGGTPSDLCESNCRLRNGMVKPPDGPGGQPAASCTLAAQDPNYGNCCGSCLASKRPDLRTFFNSNGWGACNDTSIVNNWCNGISQQATDDCRKIREGDCKAECSKDQSTCKSTGGTTGGTAGTPAPTKPPGGAPRSPGSGPPRATATPDPNGTYGNFVVIDPETTVTTSEVNPTPSIIEYFLQLTNLYNTSTSFSYIVSADDHVIYKDNDNLGHLSYLTFLRQTLDGIFTYRLTPGRPIIREINQRVNTNDIITNGALAIDELSGRKTKFYYKNLKLCNPYNGRTFAELTLVPTISAEDVYNKCKSLNKFELDFDNPNPTPAVPRPTLPSGYLNTPAYYLFQVTLDDQTNLSNNAFSFDTSKNLDRTPPNDSGFTRSGGPVLSSDITIISDPNPTFQSIPSGFGRKFKTDTIIYKTDPSINMGSNDWIQGIINSVQAAINSARNYETYPVTDTTQYGKKSIYPCFPGLIDLTPTPTNIDTNTTYLTSICNSVINKDINISINSTTPNPSSSGASSGSPINTPLFGSRNLRFDVNINLYYHALSNFPNNGSLYISVINKKTSQEVLKKDNIKQSDLGDNPSLTEHYYTYSWNANNQLNSYDISQFSDNADSDEIFQVKTDIVDSSWCSSKDQQVASITKKDLIDDTTSNLTLFTVNIIIDCPGSTSKSTVTVSGSSNEAFRIAMDRWVKGELNVLQMSAFISQLTRTPGLQITTCDPRKGECNPTF